MAPPMGFQPPQPATLGHQLQPGTVVPANPQPAAGTRLRQRSMREDAAAKYIDMSVAFLRRARLEKRGPRVTKLGRAVRYLVDDLDRWLEEQRDKGDPR